MKEKKNINIQKVSQNYSHDNNLYGIVWLLKGGKNIEVDIEKFIAYPNSIIFVLPGQRINIELESDAVGWILTFSKEYFDLLKFEKFVIKDADILSSFQGTPKMVLSPKVGERVHQIAGMIDELSGSQISNKEIGMYSLLKTMLVYCDSKCNLKINHDNKNDIAIVSAFKELVVSNFTQKHKVHDYAHIMNISPKYLYDVVMKTMGVTPKYVIQEQLIIQSRKDLKFTNKSIKEIAHSLGFQDTFHFSNFFKKMIGYSPSQYRES